MSSTKRQLPVIKMKNLAKDDDEDVVSCKICSKGFASEAALRNHARMEHISAFVAGEDIVVKRSPKAKPVTLIKPVVLKRCPPPEDVRSVEEKTEAFISSMSPTNLHRLASNDVSYIIIKSEDEPAIKKTKKDEKVDRVVRTPKTRDVQPITGPFECLQPSSLVPDGLCHQMFFSCCEYSAHHRDEHTRRRKGLRCQVCEKPLGAGPARPGDRPAPHPCAVCSEGFETASQLAEHTSTVHVKFKPYQCGVCQKRFTQQGGVQQHMRMHTGERPFPCTFCPKAFTQKSGLDQHLRIHTKIRPYRCVICNKTFCQSVHLKQHMRTHTNVSPFQCGICEKRFKQSSHLNYHLKYHNPATMTAEQRKKYEELVGIIGQTEMIEVEVDQMQEELSVEGDTYVMEGQPKEEMVECESEGITEEELAVQMVESEFLVQT